MKNLRNCALLALFVLICASLSLADEPGKHPAYLHSLSDLRYARAYLDRLTPSDRLDDEEAHAIREIDAAINEIRQAAIDDHKDLKDHPKVDAHLDHKGRYHKALELLDRAHHDVDEKEDDKFANGLKRRALGHIDEAHRIIDRLIIQTSGN